MIQAMPVDTLGVIKGNLDRIRDRIDKAARGREITLVCVTKYVDAETVEDLLMAGATGLGENRIIEGAEKFATLKARGLEFTSHLIGPVQSNKAGRVAGRFDWCQSVSRPKIADIINRTAAEAGISLYCTIEVNIGEEPQKDGALPADVSELAQYITDHCPSLELRGLMCIPPIADEKGTRGYFAKMRELFEKTRTGIGAERSRFDTLSMGMSADFDAAIEEGATMVRVGSLLYSGLPGFFD